MLKKTARIALYLFYFLIVCGILLEVGVRIWGYSAHHIYDPVFVSYPGNSNLSYLHKPNLRDVQGRGGSIFDTNAFGFRSSHPERLPDSSSFNIAVIGDSFTFGEGVEGSENLFTNQLEERLNLDGSQTYAVYNFAASGYSVKEFLGVQQEFVKTEVFDLILVAMIYGDCNINRGGLPDHFGYLNKNGSGTSFPRIKHALRSLHLTYAIRDVFIAVRSTSTARSLDKTELERLYEKERRQLNVTCGQFLGEMASDAAEKGIPMVVVALPNSGGVDRMSDLVKNEGMQVVNLKTVYEALGQARFEASPFDRHPSVEAHKAIADSLFYRLGKKGLDLFHRRTPTVTSENQTE